MYSTNCRGVPLPFHCTVNVYMCVCICVPIYYYYVCIRNYFHLILPAAKWRFLVNLLYIIIIIIIIHGNGIFFKLKTIKCVTVCMRDWIFWPDSRCLPLTVFFVYIFSRVYVILWYYIRFPYSYPSTTIILLLSMTAYYIGCIINLDLDFFSLNHQSSLCLEEINQICLARLF